MSFYDFISKELKTNFLDCKDKTYVIKHFEKYCQNEHDVIQYIQLQELYSCCNFIEILLNGVLTKQKKDLAVAVEKVSNEFDNNHIPVSVYAYYLYCILEHTGLVDEPISWVDPRDLNHSDLGKISTNVTFGVGAFNESNTDFIVKDNKLTSFKDDRIIVTIPYGIKELNSNIFKGKKKIRMISVPNTIKSLPDNLFTGLSSLEAVVLPNSITEIPDGFVKNCNNLKLVLGSSINKINDHAFENTSLISVKRLGNGHFTYIGEAAFKNCKYLTYLDLSNTQINDGALEGTNVRKLTINKNTNVKRLIDLYSEFKIDYKKVNLDKITIEFTDGIIPEAFFEDCRTLQEIEIIGDIHTIGASAFKGCENLTTLKMNYLGNVLPSYCFDECNKLNLNNIFSNIEILENNSLTLDNFNGSFVFLPKLKVVKKDAFKNTKNKIDIFEFPDGVVFEKGSLSGLNITTLVFKDLNMKDDQGSIFYPYMFFEDSIDKFNQTSMVKNVLIKTNDIIPTAFKGWENLEKVKFDVEITRIPSSCFEGCIKLEVVKFDSKNVSIGDKAFYGCESLQRINSKPGSNVLDLNNFKSIGSLAFNKCSKLKDIDMKNVSKVEKLMFNGCYSIESIILSVDKTSLPLYTLFENDIKIFNSKYSDLKKVTIYVNERIPNHYFENCINIEEIEVINDVIYLGDNAFRGCKKLSSLKMNYLGNSLPANCFNNCDNLDITNILNNIEILESNSITISMISGDLNKLPKLKLVKANAFINSDEVIPQFELPKGVEFERNALKGLKITSLSFNELKNNVLPYMLFEDSIEKFNETTHIKNIKILSSNLPEEAFKNWQTLEKIKIECPISLIPTSCFEGCIKLQGIKFESDDVEIGNRAFYGCKKLVRINALTSEGMIDFNNFKSIGKEAFTNCESFESIDMSTVNDYENLMFKGCYSLTNLSIGADKDSNCLYTIFEDDIKEFNSKYDKLNNIKVYVNKEIPNEYFMNCSNLKNIEIINLVEKLNNSCFEGCNSLLTLKINYRGNVIPKNCFKDCHQLNFLSDLSNVEIVSNSSFENCYQLEKIHLNQNVKEIGNNAFKNCFNLISLPFNIVGQTIGDNSFYGCSKLVSISLVNVKKIGQDAFKNCFGLQHIDISTLENQKLSEVFQGVESVRSIKFMDSIIPDSYFKDLSFITNISFDQPIKRIGKYAFSGCSSLKTLPDFNDVLTIGSFAFMKTAIENCVISKDAEYVGRGIFAECSNLKSIELPLHTNQFGMLFSIKKYDGSKLLYQEIKNQQRMYYLPKNLNKVKITKFLGGIGAFSNLSIADFKVDCDIEVIPSYCFYNFNGNIDIDFSKVLSIGDKAFVNTNLSDLDLSNIERIGSSVFENCSNLEILKIGYNIMYISPDVCKGSSIKKIDLISNEYYRNEDGMIISNSGTSLLFVNKNTVGEINIPSDVLVIHSNAFENCSKITKINTNHVQLIKKEAFCNCDNLKELILTEEVINIKENILLNSCNIQKLVLPFIGLNIDRPNTLNYVFGNTALNNKLDLTILNGKIIKEFTGQIAYFNTLDLSKISQSSFEVNTFKYLNIQNLILSDKLNTLEDKVFVKTYIQTLNSEGLEHDNNMIYYQDTLYYCYNQNLNILKINENIKEIKQDALENISIVDSIIVNSNNLISNKEFSKIKTRSIEITEYMDMKLTLSNEFSESLNCLEKVIYHGKHIDNSFFTKAKSIKEIKLTKVFDLLPSVFNNLKIERLELLELNSIRELYDYQFAGTKVSFVINKLVLSNYLFNIQPMSFANTTINSIEMESNDYFEVIDNLLVSKKEEVLLYAAKSINGLIVIPSRVKRINSNVFKGCNVTEINTNNVEYLDDYCFSEMIVDNVVIENNVSYIGKDILSQTEVRKLKVPFVGNKLESTMNSNLCYLFNNQHRYVPASLEKVVVTDQILYDQTFAFCSNVKEIVISNGTRQIKKNTFLNCKNLISFVIPKHIEFIEEFAFLGCSEKLILYVHPSSDINKWDEKFAIVTQVKGISKIFKKNKFAVIDKDNWKMMDYEL